MGQHLWPCSSLVAAPSAPRFVPRAGARSPLQALIARPQALNSILKMKKAPTGTRTRDFDAILSKFIKFVKYCQVDENCQILSNWGGNCQNSSNLMIFDEFGVSHLFRFIFYGGRVGYVFSSGANRSRQVVKVYPFRSFLLGHWDCFRR